MVGTLVAVFAASIVMGKLAPIPFDFSIAKPVFAVPAFNIKRLSIGVPLGLLVVCAENMQAIGVQIEIGKKPPVNAITVISGIGGIIAPFFCGHNCNIAGPMTAWAGSDDCGEVDKRYVAAVWCGIAFALTGIFAKFTMGLLAAIPAEALNMVVSLTLIGMIIGGLQNLLDLANLNSAVFVIHYRSQRCDLLWNWFRILGSLCRHGNNSSAGERRLRFNGIAVGLGAYQYISCSTGHIAVLHE